MSQIKAEVLWDTVTRYLCTFWGILSNLIRIGIYNLRRLDADIVEGLGLRVVVEHDGKDGQGNSEGEILMIGEGFAERVGAEVAFEVCPFAPVLNEAVDGGNGEIKENVVVFEIYGCKIVLNGVYAGFIEVDSPDLTRFFFADAEFAHRLEVADLAGGDADEIGGAEVGIDAEGEEGEVSGLFFEVVFNALDVFEVGDGSNFDCRSRRRVIKIGSGCHNEPS